LKELENATDAFAEGNVIGEGGYGIVYRGILQDGSIVAVKNYLNNKSLSCQPSNLPRLLRCFLSSFLCLISHVTSSFLGSFLCIISIVSYTLSSILCSILCSIRLPVPSTAELLIFFFLSLNFQNQFFAY